MRHDQVFDMKNPRPEQLDIQQMQKIELLISGADLFSKLKPEMAKIAAEAVEKVMTQMKKVLADNNIDLDYRKV